MLQVINESNIQCKTCLKRDVCKYKEEYLQTFRNIQEDIPHLNDIFTIELKCNKAVNHLLTNSYDWPSSVTLLGSDTGVRYAEPTTQIISSKGGSLCENNL